jgi:hypothetical protein
MSRAAPTATTWGLRLLGRGCSGGLAYRVGANRLGDVLDAMSAERAVIEIELVPDVLVHGVRDANSARLRQCLEPRGDVDPVTENIVAVDDDVAKVDADPQLEPSLKRDRIVDRTRRSLHCEGAVQRVDHAGEIRQQAVTCGADDPSAMRRDLRVDSASKVSKRPMRARLILAHQTAKTDHICMQDGGKFPLPRGSFSRRMRRVIEQGAHR